jgi:hypothetical protein
MMPRPPRSTQGTALFPYRTLFRTLVALDPAALAAVVAERIGCLLRWGGRAELVKALPPDHPLRRLQ